ncbi:pro-MCH [Hippoglossus hippoglossus]|uniref:pro-MCH n=1 Tax=Hippoglossus hippoglossus TaxID=8267 RepID=UPI00148E0CBE|nr:pro-MCH [Hippoglossus hippoglossus]XP_035003603.1 pro-MCH [Hippoglossus stenolepis]
MISVSSVVFTLVLFSELNSPLVTVASPTTKVEDGVIEPDGLSSFLGDEPMIEQAMVPPVYRGSLMLDNSIRDGEGNPKIFIISDMRQKGHGIRGLNSGLTRSLPLLADHKLSHTPAGYSFKMDRRDTDFNMLRCMIGRVYRPCWESSSGT